MSFRHTVLLLTLLASGASAQTYVGFFDPAGDPILHDLDWRDGTLYATDLRDDRIVSFDISTGGVTPEAALGVDPRGLAWDGAAYRVSTGFDSSDPEIVTVSEDGTQTGSIPAPSDLTNGLTFHDGLLWAARAYPDDQAAIVGLDPASGDIVETIAFPSTQPTGIAFLGDGTLWASNAGDDSGSNGDYTLYHLDRASGDVLGTLGVPPGTDRPRGLAFDGDDTLFLTVRDVATSLVYLIDLSTSGNAQVAVTPEAIDLGFVVEGETETASFMISNTGDATLTIEDVLFVTILETAFTYSTTLEDGTTIEPGASLSVDVSATADGDLRVFYDDIAVLTFQTNDVQTPQVEVPVTALAVYPEPTLSTIALDGTDFGDVRINPSLGKTEAVRTFVVRNRGIEPLTISPLQITDSAFSVYGPTSFPLTLGPDDSEAIEIAFRPTEARAYSGTLSIPSNDADSPEALTLTGTGTDPSLTAGTPLWTFGVPDNPNTVSDDVKVHSLASPGDLTGDGLADLVFASRNYLTVALDANSRDASGQPVEVWRFDTCPDNNNCGSVGGNLGTYGTGLASGADFNDDGTPDVVIATEGGNDHVYALDGASGEILWEIGSDADPFLASYNSVSVRPGYDQTGDTIPDVATGTGSASPQSPNPVNNRQVSLISGASGVPIWTFSTGLPNFRTLIYRPNNTDGIRVATGGGTDGIDILAAYAGNGSGQVWSFDPGFTPFVIEPIAEAGREDLLVAGAGGQLLRVDGASGAIQWQASTSGSVTWEVATLGRSSGPPTVVVGSSSSEVRAHNGATGDLIWTADVGDQAFGVSRVQDVDRDGVAEVIVVGKGGSAVLLSGEDGSTIWRYAFGDGSFEQSGEVATAVRDLDANGVPEVAFGTRDGRVILLFGGGGGVGTPSEPEAEAPLATLDAPFPSPTIGASVTLRYRVPASGDVRLGVYDALGREVWSREDTRAPGSYALDVPTAHLAAGTYHVRLTTDRGAVTQRFVVAR